MLSPSDAHSHLGSKSLQSLIASRIYKLKYFHSDLHYCNIDMFSNIKISIRYGETKNCCIKSKQNWVRSLAYFFGSSLNVLIRSLMEVKGSSVFTLFECILYQALFLLLGVLNGVLAAVAMLCWKSFSFVIPLLASILCLRRVR